jgi:hypothetical protein
MISLKQMTTLTIINYTWLRSLPGGIPAAHMSAVHQPEPLFPLHVGPVSEPDVGQPEEQGPQDFACRSRIALSPVVVRFLFRLDTWWNFIFCL